MNRSLLPVLVLALTFLPAACGESDANDGSQLTREQFVEVVAELREAERELAHRDSAAALFAERKEEILARYGTSEDELRAFLLGHSGDMHALRETWDSISERLKHVSTEDPESEDRPRRSRRMMPDLEREQTLH